MKKKSKKNLVFHWRVHPNLVKKASKMAIFKELVGTFSFLARKKSGPSPFCAWDFMSGIRTFRAGGTETTGWHPLLSHWDGHRLRLRSLFNSGSPKFHASGGVFCLEAKDLRQTTTKQTVQQAKTSAQGWGNWQHGADLKLSSFNWSWLYLQEWIFLPTRPSLMMSSMMFANYGKMPVWMFHREKARRLPVLFRWNWILSDLHEEF